jgi:predicted dehydrogenase
VTSPGSSPSAPAPTQIALIGVGYWGPNYARVISELPEARLAWACDRDDAKLDVVRQRWPVAATTTDVERVLGDDSVGAVVISTPTSLHAELTERALEAGKHVLCEKPLALTGAECSHLGEVAERAGRVLMVGHTFIFNPAVRRMRQLIDDGEIGDLLYCHATRTGLGPIRQDVNALWDLAPHDISILLALTSAAPVEVTAMGESYLRDGNEDVVFVNVRLENRIIARIHLSWLDPYKVRNMTVIGDRRMIRYDDIAADDKLRVFDKGASYESPSAEARGTDYGQYRAIVREGDIVIPRISAAEPLKEQMRHFIECCQTGATPETDAHAARRVVEVLEAASASLEEGGAPVAVGAQARSGA